MTLRVLNLVELYIKMAGVFTLFVTSDILARCHGTL